MTRKSICVLTLACVLLFPLHRALAHSGGTDRHGCHHNSRTGDYHCHNAKDEKDNVGWAVVGGVAAGALLLWLLADRLDCDDVPSPVRLHVAPRSADGNGLAIAAEYALGGRDRIGIGAWTSARDGRGKAHLGAYWRLRF